MKFFVSWIISSLIMFGASYLWHGVFLTDFSRLNYPLGVFLFIASFVYLLFGFILSKGYMLKILSPLTSKPFLRGSITGSVLGLIIFCVTLVSGVSFNNQVTSKVLLLDLSWQIVEQTIGGLAVGLVHFFIVDRAVYED